MNTRPQSKIWTERFNPFPSIYLPIVNFEVSEIQQTSIIVYVKYVSV